jgi:NAD(P) transhydrogenase subunit beta
MPSLASRSASKGLQNPALMIAGMLLTLFMAKAMNRSVANILFTNFGASAKHKPGDIKGSLKPAEASDASVFMRYASTAIIVPSYGLAISQGQQKVYELVKLLQAAGIGGKFAVHPVAGRMPGQMDVLLAEAGMPYDLIFQLEDINIFQLEDINDDFANTDVTLVIGANDGVNPAARTDKSSPIRMLNDASRQHFDVVLCWAIDRLGRSLIDLLVGREKAGRRVIHLGSLIRQRHRH